jgi:phosphinothricin acetyltransferase
VGTGSGYPPPPEPNGADTVRQMLIREATAGDMAAVTDIYNALIDTTTVAWTEQHQTLDDRLRWFHQQCADGYPVLVAVDDADDDDGGDRVIGFAAYASFRGAGRWPGYRYTVEHTIHLDRPAWGAGIGRALLEALIERAGADGLHVMVGAIDADNTGSIRFHERLGFVEVARMPQVGRKFDRWLDLVLMQRIL